MCAFEKKRNAIQAHSPHMLVVFPCLALTSPPPNKGDIQECSSFLLLLQCWLHLYRKSRNSDEMIHKQNSEWMTRPLDRRRGLLTNWRILLYMLSTCKTACMAYEQSLDNVLKMCIYQHTHTHFIWMLSSHSDVALQCAAWNHLTLTHSGR